MAYTSGFVFTEDELHDLSRNALGLKYPREDWASVSAAKAFNRYIARKDPQLKFFGLQPFAIPRASGDGDTLWILPTASFNEKKVIDPSTHPNTHDVKAAVLATQVPEKYLKTFATYPNPEHPT
ncbi:hypothetical protein FRC10_001199, partial [Ceratobasidium sp. 414]